jgi:DNA-binding MarR family transcriptional regulator
VAERSRRSPSGDELRIWRDYVETAQALQSRLAARMVRETSLSPGDYGILLALSETDGHRLRSSDLAAVVHWERSRLSHHVGRMEPRGLVRREGGGDDRRGAHVVLTEAGASAFRRGSVPHLRAVRESFVAAFAPEELEQVATVTARLRAHLDLGPGV